MLDLHVHVLPGIDDGPRNLDDALKLARALVADGIEHVVATPHIYPGVFDNTPHRIAEAFERLQTAVTAEGLALTMTWAAEVRICPEIIDWLEHRRLPLLDGSLVGPSTALIELPDGQIPVGTDRLAGLMLDRGITPLIAHPERNKAVMEQPSRLEALRRMGCRFQLTAGSVIGEFGSKAHATARHLLDADWVDVVASDAHNLSGRKPRMSAARQWLQSHYDAALAERLMVLTPQQIAGVSSFALGSGEQKLVFRDLPLHADADDPAWRSGLDQLDELPAMRAAGPCPSSGPFGLKEAAADLPAQDEHPTPAWSLTDFRIDTVVEGLNEASLQAGATSIADNLFTPQAAPAPAAPPSPADDGWHLPEITPSAPARRQTPTPARHPPEPESHHPSAPVLLEEQPDPAAHMTAESKPESTRMQSLWAKLKPAAPARTVAPQPAPEIQPMSQPVQEPVLLRPATAPEPVGAVEAARPPAVTAATMPPPPSAAARGLKLSDLEPLAPVVMPARARTGAVAAAAAPAPGFKPEAATDRAGTVRRGMATAAFQNTRPAPMPAMPQTQPDPAIPAPAEGTRQGFRLKDLPFLSGARR
jgi:protein-tyrosine phosphatase